MVNEVSNLLERGIHIKTLDGRLDTIAMPREITLLLVSILGYAASQEHAQIISRCKAPIQKIRVFFNDLNFLGVTQMC